MINFLNKQFNSISDAKAYLLTEVSTLLTGQTVTVFETSEIATIIKVEKLVDVGDLKARSYDFMIQLDIPSEATFYKAYYVVLATTKQSLVFTDPGIQQQLDLLLAKTTGLADADLAETIKRIQEKMAADEQARAERMAAEKAEKAAARALKAKAKRAACKQYLGEADDD